jgi:penicillin-binding protein 1A
MIGGKDYEVSPFNRATQAHRQPGSTFKTFVYLTALRQGMSPEDMIDNSEITEGSYQPRNASGRYSDEISLQDAFAQSSNVAAVRLYGLVGGDAVIETARDLGVESDLARNDPSLALGTSTMTLLELTAAYAGIAANEFPVRPHAFEQEEESWFDWLFSGQNSLWDSEHEAMQQMLRRAVNQGTGRAAMLSIANYGKTGTSQDNRDALFVGYAGDLVVGVWVGNDDNSPLNGVSGGGIPARIWKDFMVQALGKGTAPVRPTPTATPDPEGPVRPLDVPDVGDIPLGDGTSTLRIENGEAVLSTEIEGVPLNVRVGDGVFEVEPGRTPAPQ